MTDEKTNQPSESCSGEQLLSESISSTIHDFVQNVDSLRFSYSMVMGPIRSAHETCLSSWRDFVDVNKLGHPREDNPDVIEPVSPFPPEHWHEYRRLLFDLDRARRARIFAPRSLLSSLMSAFDLLMGSIVRFVLLRNPGLLNANEAMSFEKLSSFENIWDAQLFIVNRAADSLIRESRAKQFTWLEKSIPVTLKGDKELWSSFIEIEQRRHMFVHCDGRVTEDYIAECRKNGIVLSNDIELGQSLPMDEEYFHDACVCVCETGVKLAQVTWRKLLPNDINADKQFTDLCYYRIVQEDYDLAIRLLSFALDTPAFKFHSKEHELRNLLNLAQAHKWSGDESACTRRLQSADWSATKPAFRLAKACLERRFEDALGLMEEIGAKSPDVEPSCYRDWPIFKELREHDDFPALFERLFETPLIVAEPVDLNPSSNEC